MLIPIGDLIRQSLDLLKHRAKVLIPLAILGLGLTILAACLGLALLPLAGFVLGANSPLAIAFCGLVALVLATAAGLWSQLALTNAAYHGEFDIKMSLAASRDGLLDFILFGFVAALLVGGGVWLLVLPGLVFAIWFFCYPFVHMIEGLRGFDSLLKSRAYVRGREFSVLVRILVLALVSAVLGFIPFLGQAFLNAGTTVLFRNLKALHGDVPFAASPRQKYIYSGVAVLGFLALGFGFVSVMGNPFNRRAFPEPPAVTQDPRPSPPGHAAAQVSVPPPSVTASPAVPAPAKPTAVSSPAAPAVAKPAPLPKVKSAVNKDGGLLLSWDPVPGAQGYHVFLAKDGKTYKQMTTKPLAKPSVKLAKLKAGQSYSVRLAAVTGGKTGAQGPPVKVGAKAPSRTKK